MGPAYGGDEEALSQLHPNMAPIALAFFRYCRAHRNFVLTSVFRTRADQERLYAAWKRGESAFPVAKPGTSKHERGLAFDMAQVGVPAVRDLDLRIAGRIWKSIGGKWGGERDPVHFEAPWS